MDRLVRQNPVQLSNGERLIDRLARALAVAPAVSKATPQQGKEGLNRFAFRWTRIFAHNLRHGKRKFQQKRPGAAGGRGTRGESCTNQSREREKGTK